MRIELKSDTQTIAAIKSAAEAGAMATEDRDVAQDGQNFGLVEIAALIVVAKSAAELAKMLVEVWKTTKHDVAVTIKTPKGEVTVKGASTKTVDEVLAELQPALA